MNYETAVIERETTLKQHSNNEGLTVLIEEQIDKLNELDQRVYLAKKSAETARQKAKRAGGKSAGLFRRKAAIEELQEAGIELSEAVQSGAEAQEVSFEFQTKLAEISKALFGLGVSNIANNRTLIRQLEMRLDGASEEEISDLARQEIMLVVQQLKEQEDILKKQTMTMNMLKRHHKRLEDLDQRNVELSSALHVQVQVDNNHQSQLKSHQNKLTAIDNTLKLQAKTNQETTKQLQNNKRAHQEHYKQLKEHTEINRIHSEQLQRHDEINDMYSDKLTYQMNAIKDQQSDLNLHAEYINEHDDQLTLIEKVMDETNKDLATQIKSNLKTIELQAEDITMLKGEITRLKEELNTKASKSFANASLAIGGVSLILGIVHFFI